MKIQECYLCWKKFRDSTAVFQCSNQNVNTWKQYLQEKMQFDREYQNENIDDETENITICSACHPQCNRLVDVHERLRELQKELEEIITSFTDEILNLRKINFVPAVDIKIEEAISDIGSQSSEKHEIFDCTGIIKREDDLENFNRVEIPDGDWSDTNTEPEKCERDPLSLEFAYNYEGDLAENSTTEYQSKPNRNSRAHLNVSSEESDDKPGECGFKTEEPVCSTTETKECSTEDPHFLQNTVERIPLQNKCSYCLKAFGSRSELQEHRIANHVDKLYECYHCEKRFKTQKGRNQHVTCTHNDEKPFKCNECGIAFKLKIGLTRHKRLHTKSTKEFQCAQCGKFFSFRQTLRQHELWHSDKMPFKCTLCAMGYTRAESLENHIRTRHTGERPFSCDKCGKGFSSNVGLLGHKRAIHNESNYDKAFKCEQCGKQLKNAYYLYSHTRKMHSQRNYDKSFQCQQCGKQLKNAAYLKNHMRNNHSGDKQFVCDQCDKRFVNMSCLVNHKNRIHFGHTPFSCSVCEKKFAVKHDMLNHARIHTGEKPCECKKCGKKFRIPSHLSRHKKCCKVSNPI